MLIASQRPDATRVAGYRAWQRLGRQVRRGERAIRIWAPHTRTERDPDTGEETRRVFFVTVPVFDLAQTDGEPLPEAPGRPVSGESHAHLVPALEAFAAELGYRVEYVALAGGVQGLCDPDAKRVLVGQALSANARAAVLVHELAHALGVGYAEYGRADAEVIVETAAWIVLAGCGLDTSSESVPYVAGWGEASDLEAIRCHAETVDRIARGLERAIGVADDADATSDLNTDADGAGAAAPAAPRRRARRPAQAHARAARGPRSFDEVLRLVEPSEVMALVAERRRMHSLAELQEQTRAEHWRLTP